MKKVILFAIVLMGGVLNVCAQQATYGIVGGATLASSTFEVGGDTDNSTALGYHIGLQTQITFNETWSLQPEILFTSLYETGDDAADDALNFIQVPVFMKYFASENFYILGGPQATFLLDTDIDTQEFTKFNIGAGLGLGYIFSNQIFIESRAIYQINNSYIGDGDVSSRRNFVNLSLGYKF